MATVYLGLGTNVGDRFANLRSAVAELRDVRACSSVYESEPWGNVDQPRFFNMCLELRTQLAPEALHAQTKAVEQQLGRRPGGQRWGPRPIDIDLLSYDNLVLCTERLAIPHPRIADRAFVLKPLAEIAPGLRLPGLPGTVAELLSAVPHADRLAWVVAPPLC
jgi:2-amino-4-hydroxy-6-hydroxymethyldihydropteridine diphosphokinase